MLGAFLGRGLRRWRGSCGWWFWGFCFCRGYAVICGRLYGGVLLTVAAVGVFLSVVGGRSAGFSSAPVVAVVSAALWCRDWRLALPAAAPLALFLAALVAG